jgi:hypothetical protein
VNIFWIIVAVVAAVSLVILLRPKSRGVRETDYCCECCCADCCCELGCGAFNCCTLSSLPMFVIGVVALGGGGLAAVGWLVLSLARW